MADTVSQIVLASGNRHKYQEFCRLLANARIELLFGGDFKHPIEVDETGSTYEENALLKAAAWAQATNRCALSDDSGVEVEALGWAPGIHSARAAPGSDEDRVRWLLDRLGGRKAPSERAARYVACLVLAWPDGTHRSWEGVCDGHIAHAPSGANGFGYDPIFVPQGYSMTFGELSQEEKDRISHRAVASRGVVDFLNGR